ncbi:MAG TPA: hypothetical protein VGN63_24590 [Flavisolibacter sp.]|jgi:hypothetical protein|nr:hypothetical protein [Flavisolibacter sp.]
MKKIVRNLLTAFLLLTTVQGISQDISGIWRGYFITEGGEQYKYEVQLDQTKKNSLSGVTYSYLDTRFYGKATFTGNYTKTSNAALVQEIKTVELKMAGGSVACIMKCRLVYSRSGREEFLEGIYTSAYEKNDPFYGVKKGGDCGGGKVFLRKVSTSDFYVEPFLRNKKTTADPPQNSIAKTPQKKTVTKTPAKKETATTKTTTKANTPVTNKTIAKPVPVQTETQKPEELTVAVKPAVVPRIKPTPATIRDRKNELIRTIVLTNSEVEISLYDNGEVDNDTVSIYLNGALLLANKRLSNKPITYKLKIDETNPEHTLVMVAENLGTIPPNTSLMIIQDGDNRHQVNITSTEQKNAMIRFRYEKQDP